MAFHSNSLKLGARNRGFEPVFIPSPFNVPSEQSYQQPDGFSLFNVPAVNGGTTYPTASEFSAFNVPSVETGVTT